MKINGIRVHKDITEDVVLEAAERQIFDLDNPGFCILCGVEIERCEPDMRKGPCESCGAEATVYGAQELLLYMVA